MACDGDIAQEEVELLRKITKNDEEFKGIDVQGLINGYISAINKEGKGFLNSYIEEVKEANLDDSASIKLIKIAIDTIEADKQIEYSEISFFKRIRRQLAISDAAVLEVMPDKEDYLLPDIEDDSIFDWNTTFDSIVLTEIAK